MTYLHKKTPLLFRVCPLFFLLASLALIACSQTEHYDEGDLVIDWQRNGHFQSYNSHEILRVSDRPLFRADGSVDRRVLFNLLAIINDPSLDPMLRVPKREWSTGIPYTGPSFRAVTAEDFSRFVVPNPYNRDHSGAIIIKLFETVPRRQGRNIHRFTSQWWQLVYRATDDDRDVLTLWMFEPYRLSVFNGNRYDYRDPRRVDEFFTRMRRMRDGIYRTQISVRRTNTIRDDYGSRTGPQGGYTKEGNYSASIARTNLLRDANKLFSIFDVKRFISAPADLPGEWQSSYFQTGSNYFFRFYVSGLFQESNIGLGWETGSVNMMDGLGAASRIWGPWDMFFLKNGKDGLSVGPDNGHWRHTRIESTYHDLLWLPSDFETRSMGHNKDNARFQTFIQNPGNRESALITNRIPEDRPDRALGRSGLWRLNGFDRGFNRRAIRADRAWLRSACSGSIGNINTITPSGNRYEHGVTNRSAMRPGIHLNLSSLVKELSF